MKTYKNTEIRIERHEDCPILYRLYFKRKGRQSTYDLFSTSDYTQTIINLIIHLNHEYKQKLNLNKIGHFFE